MGRLEIWVVTFGLVGSLAIRPQLNPEHLIPILILMLSMRRSSFNQRVNDM